MESSKKLRTDNKTSPTLALASAALVKTESKSVGLESTKPTEDTKRAKQSCLFCRKLHDDLLLEMVIYLDNNDHAKLSQACFYLSNILSLDDGWGTAYDGKYYPGRRHLTKGLKQLRQVTFRHLKHSNELIHRLTREMTLLKTYNVDMIQHEDYKYHLPTEITLPELPASVEIFKMNQILYVKSFEYLFGVVLKNCSSRLKRLDIRVGFKPWVEWFHDLLKGAIFDEIQGHSLFNLTHLVLGLIMHGPKTKCDTIKFQEYMAKFFSTMPNLIHLECHFSFPYQGVSVHHAVGQGHFSHLQSLVLQCHDPMTILDLRNLKHLTSLVIKESFQIVGNAPLQRYFLPQSLTQLHMTGVSSFPHRLLTDLIHLKHFEMNGQCSMKNPDLPGHYTIAKSCPNLETFIFHVSHHTVHSQSADMPYTLESWLEFFNDDLISVYAAAAMTETIFTTMTTETETEKKSKWESELKSNRVKFLSKLKLFVVCESEETFNRVKNKNQARRKLQEQVKTKIQKMEEIDESDDDLNDLDDRLMVEEYLNKCTCGTILGKSATIEKFQKLRAIRPNMQFVVRLDSVYMNTHVQDNCQVLKTQQDNNGWTPFCLSDYIPNPTSKSHYEIL